MPVKHDPETYERMRKPFGSVDEYAAAAKRFLEVVEQLRKDCELANVYVIVADRVHADGEDRPVGSIAHWGSSDEALPMVNWARSYELKALSDRIAATPMRIDELEAKVAELEGKAKQNEEGSKEP